ncbi:MAG: hypothetical protein ABSA93_27055 [Streptosporangiaceae bacterium]
MSGAISLIMASSASAALVGTAQAATASPCGPGATTGVSSCSYMSAGQDTFTVPEGVYSADFTVDGAQAASVAGTTSGPLGSVVSAVLQVLPGETFQVNVGGVSVANVSVGDGSSSVSVGSSTLGAKVLVAAGGTAQSASGGNYVTQTAKSQRSAADAHAGNGEVTVSWAQPTSLTATPAVLGLSGLSLYLFNLSATLTDGGGPVAGQQITFTSGSTQLCTATTDAEGTASCSATMSLLSIVLSLGYTASFAGNTNDQAASASAGLIG